MGTSTEVLAPPQPNGPLAAQQTGMDIAAVIAAAARDPEVNVEKMSKLLEMHERIEARKAETAFTEAMNSIQARVPRIVKDRKIIVKGSLRSKYAALEDIDKALRPLVLEAGFSLMYSTEDVPPKATKLILTVKHRLGHKEPFTLTLPIDNNEFRSPSQNTASTVSFGRRILLCMAFNVITVDEDIDGNEKVEFITEEQVLKIVDCLNVLGLSESDPGLLAWLGVDRLEHIMPVGFPRVLNELKKRMAKLGGGNA
jgi:hypothetical protein